MNEATSRVPPSKRRRPIAPPTTPPLIPTDVQFVNDPSVWVTSLFGCPIVPGILAAMSNAPSGADAIIQFDPAPGGFQARTAFIGGHAIRVFWRHDTDGILEAQNWDFRLYQAESVEGAGDWQPENNAFDGTELFTNQVRALRHVGVERIWTLAARTEHEDPNKKQVGYCVWPKMGFDAPLPDAAWEILPEALREQILANVIGSRWPRSLLALVSTIEGSKWWAANGIGLECAFDLGTDSLSMRTLAAYLSRRNNDAA